MKPDTLLDRRSVIAGFGLAVLLATPRTTRAANVPTGLKSGAIDLSTPAGNVLALAKITATLEPGSHTHGWYSGVLMGVVPGEAVRELVGIIGMSTQRLRPVPEQGGYQLLQKECGFFTDLGSGRILDRWTNPYLKEEVEPFHIANPAVNRWILPVVREERFYDRADGSTPALRPFVLPWQRAGDRLMLEQRSHFWAQNPLDPAIWKRESNGARIQVSDMLSYSASWADVIDPRKNHVNHAGHWVHVRPWQPWMLMGAHPGHCLYSAMTGSATTLTEVPAHIAEVVSARLPEFLVPPQEVQRSEPSMVRFKRERKPAASAIAPPDSAD
ncbi:MAG: DUF1838 family protein [Pseudomonadales bacterium]|nr:DUF1838 family protein [Pseudomonadales bacterium]